MTGIRRALILIGLTAAVILGASIPASATFADSSAVGHTVGTLTVAAPTSVSTAGTRCTSRQGWNGYTWGTIYELQAKVSWPATKTTRGVTGYRVTAVMSDGSKYALQDVGPSTLSMTGTFPIAYASANIRVTITTLTSYGWTAESAPSGVIRC
jgi:hypothetical protein